MSKNLKTKKNVNICHDEICRNIYRESRVFVCTVYLNIDPLLGYPASCILISENVLLRSNEKFR